MLIEIAFTAETERSLTAWKCPCGKGTCLGQRETQMPDRVSQGNFLVGFSNY